MNQSIEIPPDIPAYLRDIYLEGYESYKNGVYLSPYENTLPLNRVWTAGWCCASSDDFLNDFEMDVETTQEEETDYFEDDYRDPEYWERFGL